MKFAKIEADILIARKESSKITIIEPRLGSFIVGYLVVDIVSEFENRIEEMFTLRAHKLNDGPNTNFIKIMMKKNMQTPNAENIHRLLKHHHASFFEAYEKALTGTRCETALGNLIKARHWFAHKEGSQSAMTLQDVERDYAEAAKLFDVLATVLGLTAADCAHLT